MSGFDYNRSEASTESFSSVIKHMATTLTLLALAIFGFWYFGGGYEERQLDKLINTYYSHEVLLLDSGDDARDITLAESLYFEAHQHFIDKDYKKSINKWNRVIKIAKTKALRQKSEMNLLYGLLKFREFGEFKTMFNKIYSDPEHDFHVKVIELKEQQSIKKLL